MDSRAKISLGIQNGFVFPIVTTIILKNNIFTSKLIKFYALKIHNFWKSSYLYGIISKLRREF